MALARRLPKALWTLAAVLALLFGVAGTARADSPDERDAPVLPRDVEAPHVTGTPVLPPLPPDFETFEEGGWLQVSAPSSVHDRIVPLLREASDFRAREAENLGQPPLARVVVRVVRSPEQMAELAPEGAPPPPYAAGVAYPELHFVMLALKAPVTWEAPDLGELMRHELTHVALADAVGEHHVPRWFNEGLAIHESGELPWARTKTLWDAKFARSLIPLHDLDAAFPADGYAVNVAYAESADFVAFLMRDADRARFGSLVQRVGAGFPFDRALEDAYGTDARKLEFQWREEIDRRFGVLPMLTGGGVIWVLIAVLAAMAWIKRRRQAKAKLEQWAFEEAQLDAAAVAARDRETAGNDDDLPSRVPPAGVVEHEGRWYTLH
jgi:hypothetical protein